MKKMDKIPLLSRKLLFGNSDRALAKISPDGSKLAYLAPKNGFMNIWVGTPDKINESRPVSNDTVRGIRMFDWAYTSEHILYIQDKGGDENFHIFSVDLKSGNIIDLTPFDNVQARISCISSKYPDKILVLLNNRIPEYHDLYLIDITNGESELVFENKYEFAELYTDNEFRLRFSSKMTADGGSIIFQQQIDRWEKFIEIPMQDYLTTSLAGMNHSGNILYLNSSIDRNTSALITIDLTTGERKLVAEDDRSDAGGIFFHPKTKDLLAVEFNYLRKEWKVVDDSIKDDFEYLQIFSDSEFVIINTSENFDKWIVVFYKDDGPHQYYLYKPAEKKRTFLFTNRTDMEGILLSKMEPVVVKSRDALGLVCYYTLPPQYKGQKKPEKPLPMVLEVHGGPWDRDVWGYNAFHQWMANRGYVCMSINYRGSTGFGKDFVNAGMKEWAGKMHDDLIDAVNWAIEEGIADPNKIAITGGSYGGFATLVGMTFTPDVFACGVDLVGPSNLVTLLNSLPSYWEPTLNTFYENVGDNRTKEGIDFLLSRSPLTYIERIKKPLLIAQGANDPRVKQSEADQIVNAMKEKNIPVTYILFPDEGHGFARPENMISYCAVTEIFLSGVLGGRYEEFGDDLKGSSIQVPVGASIIPELEDKLK